MKLASDEVVYHELKPSNKLIVIWFFSKCLVHGLASAFCAAFIWHGYTIISNANKGVFIDEFQFFVLVGCLLFVFGCVCSYIYHRFLIATLSFTITDRRCVWRGGILHKVEHTVAYQKITDVERSQNILEQMLGISTINLFTPGTSSMRAGLTTRPQAIPELRFEGLLESDDVAETINEQVRKRGSIQPF